MKAQKRRMVKNGVSILVLAAVLATMAAAFSIAGSGSPAQAAEGHVANHGDTSLIEERTWYVAEGCTRTGYETWILVQNPDPEQAHVTMEFQLPAGQSAPRFEFDLPGDTRRTVHLNALEGLAGTDVSTVITSTERVMVERTMYFIGGEKGGGHASMGSPCPYPGWYFAEGYTGGSFDTWILMQNPLDHPAEVTMEFQLPEGQSAPEHKLTIPGNTRASVSLDQLPGLASTDVSTKISSTVPIVAERSMYFENNGQKGSHSTLGINDPAQTSFLAEGYTGGSFETYVLLQNPGPEEADVTLTFQVPSGRLPEKTGLTIPGNTRRTLKLNDVPGLEATDVSTIIESDEEIIAERSMYFYYDGHYDGHCAEGVDTPFQSWFLPEGYTGPGFDTWVLVQNASSEQADVHLEFHAPAGIEIEPLDITLQPESRRSVLLNAIDGFPATDVSTTVTSEVPVVAERSVYFDSEGRAGGTCGPGYRANELTDNALILDDASTEKLEGVVDSDDRTMTFSQSSELVKSIRVGDVVMAGDSHQVPDGMLRKVIDVKRAGTKTVLETEQAKVTEAIKYGNFFGGLEGDHPAGGPVRQASADVSYGFDTGKISASLKNVSASARVQMNGDLYLNLSVGWHWKWYPPWYVPYLKYFQVENDIHSTVDLSASIDPGTLGGSKTIYTRPLAVIDIGPLVFVPNISISIGASGSVDSHCDFGVEGKLTDLDAGIIYDDGWRTKSNAQVDGSLTQFNPPSGGDFTLYVEEALNVLLYDIVGPYISIREGPHAHINKSDNPWWTVDMRFWSLGGVDISVFGIIHIKWDATIFDFRIPIAHAPYRPELKGVKPTSGNVGNQVTLTGRYFGDTQKDDSYVTFGGVKAKILSWSDGQILCQVPPGAVGVASAKVTTNGGTSSGIDFTVIPWLDHLSADSGRTGTPVTLFGSGFGAAQGTSYVSFGGKKATVKSWGADQVTCLVPADLPPVTAITITTAGGASQAARFGVIPNIDSVTPDGGVVGSSVTIKGSGFGADRGNSYVRIGNTVTDYGVWSDTSITCTVPQGVSGVAQVAVITEGGTSNGVPFNIIPAISRLQPKAAQVYQPVTISGTGFGPAQGSSFVTFNSTQVSNYASWGDTSIVCHVPLGAGGVTKVRVTTPGGRSAGKTFNVVPTLVDISPDAARVGDKVTLTGNAFNRDDSAVVSFGGVEVTEYDSWSYDTIVCEVPGGAYGVVQVTVTNQAGVSNPQAFSVIPTINDIDPPAAEIGDSVTIEGTGFGPAQNGSSVSFGGVAGTDITSWSNKAITLNVPDGIWRRVGVTVTTAGGTSSPEDFGVIPTFAGLDPASGTIGSGVTLTGNGFGPDMADSSVTFDGVPVAAYSLWSNNRVECLVPGRISGVVRVLVTTAGGASGGREFAVIPTITAIDPPASLADGVVTITGNAFGGEQGDSTVTFGDWPVTAFESWADEKIVCRVPRDASGEVMVTVTTDGGTSTQVKFDVIPFILRIGPTSGGPGSVMTIDGSGFGAEMGNSKVLFGTTLATPTSWSNYKIKCTVPTGPTAGTVEVNTAGGVSNTLDFTVLAPTWYLAEGTCAWGFDTYITIENPNDEELTARVTYMTPNGDEERPDLTLPPESQTTIRPEDDLGFKTDFSTKIECAEGKTIAVDRTMSWTGTGAPSPETHNSIGTPCANINWFLPEGCSDFGFETWLLIQNPGKDEATCEVTYMIDGQGPRTTTKKVPPASRRTYNMLEDIGPASSGMEINSDVPVIAECAVYRDARRQGHETIATTLPAHNYYESLGTPVAHDAYFAEGSTDHGFTTYLLVLNPNEAENNVQVTYMTGEGPVVHEPFVMAARSRKTIRVNDFLPGKDFAIHVRGDRPLAADRAMYWGAGTPLGEASHDTIGMTDPHDTFYFPDGQVSGGHETYTCVQNPNDKAVDVVVSYLSEEGKVTSFEVSVPVKSRRTFDMADHVESGRAAVLVRCKDPADRIMAERSIYSHKDGAGCCSTGGFQDTFP